jgi:hypothetical protein
MLSVIMINNFCACLNKILANLIWISLGAKKKQTVWISLPQCHADAPTLPTSHQSPLHCPHGCAALPGELRRAPRALPNHGGRHGSIARAGPARAPPHGRPLLPRHCDPRRGGRRRGRRPAMAPRRSAAPGLHANDARNAWGLRPASARARHLPRCRRRSPRLRRRV